MPAGIAWNQAQASCLSRRQPHPSRRRIRPGGSQRFVDSCQTCARLSGSGSPPAMKMKRGFTWGSTRRIRTASSVQSGKPCFIAEKLRAAHRPSSGPVPWFWRDDYRSTENRLPPGPPARAHPARLEKLILAGFGFMMRHPAFYQWAARAGRIAQPLQYLIRGTFLDPLRAWTSTRSLPSLARQSFRQRWREGKRS